MKMKAAVLYEGGTPLKIEEVILDDPKVAEIRVKLVATGLCHTDFSSVTGEMPCGVPVVLGHEGSGIVDAIGPGVTSVKPGDKVILFATAPCGKCFYCQTGRPNLCDVFCNIGTGGTLVDGTCRLHLKDGTQVSHFFFQSSFAEYCVVPEGAAVKVPDNVPLEKVCGLGCGFSTGTGAALNGADIQPGETVAVFGLGGVGMSIVMGAHLKNPSMLFAIDFNEKRLALAKELGATHLINPAKEDPPQTIILETGMAVGGVDWSFEACGAPQSVQQAYSVVKRGGTAVQVGAAPYGLEIGVDVFGLIQGRSIKGIGFGSCRCQVDIPRWVDLFMKGKLPYDKLATKTFKLDDIDKAIEAMEKGEVIKPVIVFK